jgi:hypothetical protein
MGIESVQTKIASPAGHQGGLLACGIRGCDHCACQRRKVLYFFDFAIVEGMCWWTWRLSGLCEPYAARLHPHQLGLHTGVSCGLGMEA